ncbi:MAG: nicotinamide mononucleotide transporter [Victivallales bacterium]|nr:nicotinamide mononucleotide transporter [Victivallales bacterium]
MTPSYRKILIDSFPLALTTVLITVTGIIYHQAVFRILPLYISIVVSILQSKVNRNASLIGGLNSILYACVDWHYGLYAISASDLLVSCPFQLATFILWTRRSYKHSTMLRRMSWRQRMVAAIICILVWLAVFFTLRYMHSNYQIIDSSMTLFGLLIYVLTLFAFVEYTWLMIPNCLANILLNVIVMANEPDRITFLVFSIYSLYCNVLGFIQARRLYAEQQVQAAK